MKKIERITLIVLDSVGAGELPDANLFDDCGSNTLGNMAKAYGGMSLPNMGKLGLGNITEIEGTPAVEKAEGAYGRAIEVSHGKDSTTGHWFQIDVDNYVLSNLPSTDGMGITPFISLGVMFLLLAVICVVFYLNKKSVIESK